MDALTLRLEGCGESPGKGWEAVEGHANIWVLEIKASRETLSRAVVSSIDSVDREIRDRGQITLFINLWEEGMSEPLVFNRPFVQELASRGIAIEIWR